jgi:tripartite-type tricarboxylate transporter receptor subunit TctC
MFRIAAAAFAALAVAWSGAAPAADYPARPVRILTPFAAGGGIDIITRAVGQRLGQHWNQQVIVENRPGAGATMGYAAGAKAPADGYTLVLGANPLGIGPVVYPNLPYDARRDFAPISLLASTPEVLAVNAAAGLATAADLVARAKKEAKKTSFGSAGSGTLAHLAAESFNRRAGLGGVHVPYKGSSPALVDLLGGQIDWLFDSPSALMPGLQSGKLRALAIAAAQRSPQLPNVPTLAEAGFPDMDFRIWVGLMAPAATPEAVVKQIEAAIADIFKDPAMRNTIATQGWDIVGSSARDFAAFLDKELPNLADAARTAGVKGN